MKRILLALVIPWSLVGAPLPAVAQSPELMAAYRQYEALEALGKVAEAEPFARKALELGEAEFGTDHPRVATSLNSLAALYYAQGRYGEAEPLHKRSLAIKEKALGPDHLDVAKSLNNLAELYRAPQGADCCRSVYSLRGRIPGRESRWHPGPGPGNDPERRSAGARQAQGRRRAPWRRQGVAHPYHSPCGAAYK